MPDMVLVNKETLRKAMVIVRMKQDDVRAVRPEWQGYDKAHQLDMTIERIRAELTKAL